VNSPSQPEEISIDLEVSLTEDRVAEIPATGVKLGNQKSGVWTTFFSTFITIFLAEMGDKTQLATLLLSAQSGSPWIVFIGAGSALIATSLVGVLLGRYLAKVLSPETLDIAAGILLMVISILLLGDVVQL
jgi:Ca2+/H+ antiporter, TMEM165/GDT1 family